MKKKSLLITAIAILGFAIVSMAQTVPSYVPTSGLVGWWPFTGNANDSSGNGNNGTVSGPTLTTDRFGVSNSAYSFSSCNEIHANINTSSITIGMTLSFWYYRNATGCIGPRVMEFSVGSLSPGGLIMEENYPTGIKLAEYTSGGYNPLGWLYFAPLNDRTWSHYVYTNDGIQQKTYQDGILINTYTSPGNSVLDGDVAFGRMNHPAYDGVNGNLDDIGIWNRALDSCEVKDLYAASLGNCCHISISTQPLSQSASISNNVQFTTSSDSSATYQWQSDLGVGFQNINSVGQYSGTTNDTLSVSSVTMSNNNQPFRCIIRSGSCYDTSDIAILNVCGAVTTPPVNQNVVINNTAQFTTASSDLLATYQWQTDLGVGFQNINSVGQYSGTNKDTLRVANVTMGNNNQPFRCIVSSGACSDTSNAAVLTVINANGINETSANNLFTVYPNPAKSQINVKADATLIGYSYTVYNNIGKATLTGKINAENTVLDLGHLSSGVYLFSIGDSLKQKFTVVKE